VLELGVAVGVLLALDGLVRRLQAVIRVTKNRRDRLGADPNAEAMEHLVGKLVRALGGPAERRLRVTARDGIDKRLDQ
jgi:hypothetical protein